MFFRGANGISLAPFTKINFEKFCIPLTNS